ncbi:unnamed protein product [Thelazia callipaeda]|uniref:Haloacid dehalogenase-like hydrolase domain-containing protein 2 n=1 Tax=Thelazia callipaeda TaxID=103827 RepID=A0A0N5CPH4_THECL|nr:unnamed protein product [Thelazia callipaeda]
MSSGIVAVLIDLSGTLHVEDLCIKGVPAALLRLRQNPRYLVKFVTNTTKVPCFLSSSRVVFEKAGSRNNVLYLFYSLKLVKLSCDSHMDSSNRLHERLAKLGLEISQSEIFTSLSAAKQLIKKNNLRPLLFLEDSAMEDFADLEVDNPNAVVVGLAPSKFCYSYLNQAFRLLLSGAKLVAIHKGRYYRQKDGLSLGPGPFVEALEYATGVKSEVVGKPESMFFLTALNSLQQCLRPEQVVMIGDDVRDDVLGALNVGMHGILVKTGKYCEGIFIVRFSCMFLKFYSVDEAFAFTLR